MTEQEWLTSEDASKMLGSLLDGVSLPTHKISISDRKARLIAIAIARHGGCGTFANDSPWLISCAEKIADSLPHDARLPLHDVYQGLVASWLVELGARECAKTIVSHYAPDIDDRARGSQQAAILRDLVGNPYRPIVTESDYLSKPEVALAAWGTAKAHGRPNALSQIVRYYWRMFEGDARSLALAAYNERLPDGTLDLARLAVLSDALEEAGCNNEDVLWHLRGQIKCDFCSAGMVKAYRGEPSQGYDLFPCALCDGRGYTQQSSPHYRGCWALDLVLEKE